MNKPKYVFSQLVAFMDSDKFRHIVDKYGGNRYVKHFTCWNQLLTTSLDAYITGLRYSGFSEVYEYRINGDGTIDLHHILEPEGQMPALLPRIGLTMTLCDDMQQVKWYGLLCPAWLSGQAHPLRASSYDQTNIKVITNI
jgi:hypothetical protein